MSRNEMHERPRHDASSPQRCQYQQAHERAGEKTKEKFHEFSIGLKKSESNSRLTVLPGLGDVIVGAKDSACLISTKVAAQGRSLPTSCALPAIPPCLP